MDRTGLVTSIVDAATNIDFGRKAFAIRGREHEGRVSYEIGIAESLSAFVEAQASDDPQTIILVEYTFLTQELQLCDETDKDVFSSLSQAIQSFDDAFLCLKVVENADIYKLADNILPHSPKYRIHSFPKDAFHIACIAHRTRIRNILRTPGMDTIEKALLKQRFASLGTAQKRYVEKQKKALPVGTWKE